MPIGTTALMIGATGLGAASQIIAGNKASNAQQKGIEAGIAEQRRQYDTTREDFAPWRTAGTAALGTLTRAYGLDGQPADRSTFFTSPGYEFRRDEGIKAVERSAASRGLLKSGAAVKGIERFAEGNAAGEYDSWWNRLAGLAGVGQSAAGSTAQAGMNAANNITNASIAGGNARASSYANTGSAINSGINNVLFSYLNQGKGG